jgi:Arc/MetJ-type ribon-helix-helix transcriptional regulator
MRTKSTVISLKLTPTELLALRDLVREGWYESASAAIRDGLGMIFAKHKLAKPMVENMERERLIHRPRKGKRRFTSS